MSLHGTYHTHREQGLLSGMSGALRPHLLYALFSNSAGWPQTSSVAPYSYLSRPVHECLQNAPLLRSVSAWGGNLIFPSPPIKYKAKIKTKYELHATVTTGSRSERFRYSQRVTTLTLNSKSVHLCGTLLASLSKERTDI